MNYSKLEKYELTGDDIQKVLGYNIKLIPYPELKKYSSIFDCFDDRGRCVLFLIENKVDNTLSGHYQCLTLHNDGERRIIEFFDSYGLSPAGWNKYIPESIQQKLNELSGTMLIPLLKKASETGAKIIYNHNKLQKMANDVDTCGRFVCTRLINHALPLSQFIIYLDKLKSEYQVKTYDQAVSQYIYNILGK
jgi:hypothetical protein